MELHEVYDLTSRYVSMRDGTRLAIDLYSPSEIPAGGCCTILVNTRYGRRTALNPDAKAALRTVPVAIVAVDSRGSGASFGRRTAELSPDEMLDVREVIDWIVRQPWSDGRVVPMGNSYSGDASDIIASIDHPAIVGSVSRCTEFDPYAHLMFPGGVRNVMMAREWGALTASLDAGCDVTGPAWDPDEFPHLAPVDEDVDRSLLAAAVTEHLSNHRVDRDLQPCEFRDDEVAPGLTFDDLSIFSRLDHRLTRPSQYFGTWMDGGTADSALRRFATLSAAPMEVYLGAWSHGALHQTDPFGADGGEPSMPGLPQYQETARFIRRLLTGNVTERVIHYYTLGAGCWRTTSSWPPPQVRTRRLFLAPDGALTDISPQTKTVERHEVSFLANTGERSRWHAQMGVVPRYDDRSRDDEQMLCFTTARASSAFEVSGRPVLQVQVRTAFDAALFAYLEDLGPDGVSTYLTEGQLRIGARKLGSAPYAHDGPWPTCRRADFSPPRAEEWVSVTFELFPISVLVREGHALRLCLAGADAAVFARYPADETEVSLDFAIGAQAAYIDVPVADWPG